METFIRYFFRLVAEQTENVSIVSFIATALIGILAVNLVWLVMERKTDRVVPVWKKRVIIALIIYVSITYHITFDSREAGSKGNIVTALDFGSWRGDYFSVQQMIYSVLNVLLFIPFGFLMGILKRECTGGRRILLCTLYSFLGSFCIECVQLVTARGYFEVTDIVTNTLGGMCGSLLASAIYVLKKSSGLNNPKGAESS